VLRIVGGLGILLTVAGSQAAADETAKELERLQGRWKLKDADDSDDLAKNLGFVRYTLVIGRDRMTKEYENGTK
jgi:uncharacterized protein (TIGR03067 family)